ncbi:MAG: hypothetical protein Aurels2KO_18770 [Aureliella sp.]
MTNSRLIAVLFLVQFLGSFPLAAQNEVGYIESFALADDRAEALAELIPGTDDFFYYHCLHQQNERELAEASATIDRWRVRQPKSTRLKVMAMRQAILNYGQQPGPAIELLRRELNVNTNHSAPQRDVSASLPSEIDNAKLRWNSLLSDAIARDRSLAGVVSGGLPSLVSRDLTDEQVRQLVGRLERADTPGALQLITRELSIKGSRGFGWAPVHQLLTLEQLEGLASELDSLLGNDAFLGEYLPRLLPRVGESLDRPAVLLSYLDRLKQFVDRLPKSQYNLKALVIGNLLKVQASQGVMDRQLFLDYLQLPSAGSFYNKQNLRNVPYRVDARYQLSPQVALSPVGDDARIVQQYLEHFLLNADNADEFAPFIESGYLARVFAEVKILSGVGDADRWYGMLSPKQQREVRDRVELRFAATNQTHYEAGDTVSLDIQCKNLDEVVVKVYQIHLRNFYRNERGEISTAIDLDGLVPNFRRTLDFSMPADRRHQVSVRLPELSGDGVWVVDLLGGGVRSRALVRRGGLSAVERMSDAGQQFAIFDQSGKQLVSAQIELGGTVYEANSDGWITIPPAAKQTKRKMLLIHGDFVQSHTFNHASEQYQLHASFVVDRESLVSGNEAAVLIASRLTCNRRPVASELLDDLSLDVTATNLDGVSTSQTVTDLELSDSKEWLYRFSVPSRLAELRFELSGSVVRVSDDRKQVVRATGAEQCNGIHRTRQIYDVFLTHRASGYALQVSGRRGEAAQGIALVVSAKHRWLRDPIRMELATDEQGLVQLGQLDQIATVAVQCDQFRDASFTISKPERSWPTEIQVVEQRPLTLPLGADDALPGAFSLCELRGGRIFRDVSESFSTGDGALRIAGLPSGDYELRDWDRGTFVRLQVETGRVGASYVMGASRTLELTPENSVTIRSVTEQAEKLRVHVDGADGATRVHVCVHSFAAGRERFREFSLPLADPAEIKLRSPRSYYVDSLKLDEEYSYILNRRNADKYAGNMLVQPSLLIHPWEIAKTSNLRRDAVAGAAIPNAAPDGPMAEGEPDSRAMASMGASVGWKSYEHLAAPSFWICNVPVENGIAEVPLEELEGYGMVSVYAVHPSSVDVRHLPRSDAKLEFNDSRLSEAFDSDVPLGQSETVKRLQPDQVVQLGGSYAQQFQVYDTLGGVFQLYSTILDDTEFTKFSFVGRWLQLSDAEKSELYSAHACHELNLFLNRRDPEFFNRVVRPFIAQKVEKQFIDLWLLDAPIDDYMELHRFASLNTLERILLSQRNEEARRRTMRWMKDTLEAEPLDRRSRRKLFDVALLGKALSAESKLAFGFDAEPEQPPAAGGLGGGGRSRSLARRNADFGQADASFFGMQRKMGRGRQLFETLPSTKKWAETNYYRVQFQEQDADLIKPSSFWLEVLEHGSGTLLPTNIDLACRNRNEALCALAWIDLPEKSTGMQVSREDGKLFGTAKSASLLVREAIEPLNAPGQGAGEAKLLVGQEIYEQPSGKKEAGDVLVDPTNMVRGRAYTGRTVVTNPSNKQQHASVLVQVPAGSIALAGSSETSSVPVDLQPYDTQQIEYAFYFPAAGEFSHYGTQVSDNGQLVAAAESRALTVVSKPAVVDDQTWQYVADWGTDDQVIAILKTANLQEIDVDRIAFRMADESMFTTVTDLLRSAGVYRKKLWAYALVHGHKQCLSELLSQSYELLSQLGPAFQSPIVTSSREIRRDLEHLDFRPLVVARSHMLGTERVILNPELRSHYLALLELIAHQRSVSQKQRLQLCYYMLLQNRIGEAIRWFDSVDRQVAGAPLQTAYFDAYLEFYRGDYDRAQKIAEEYVDYPVIRWRDMFKAIVEHVDTRDNLLANRPVGGSTGSTTYRDSPTYRGERNDRGASESVALEMNSVDGKIVVTAQRLSEIQVNFYEMDIELLFSRRPFVSMNGERPPAIAPNKSSRIELPQDNRPLEIEIPDELKNRNMIVEVTGGGLSKSTVVTAGEIRAEAVQGFGQVRTRHRVDGAPVVGAYVKVYGRQRGGQVRFFKDGYTDLRGYFDYASLSTNDLDSVERFSILVLDEELGAVVLEAAPPTR